MPRKGKNRNKNRQAPAPAPAPADGGGVATLHAADEPTAGSDRQPPDNPGSPAAAKNAMDAMAQQLGLEGQATSGHDGEDVIGTLTDLGPARNQGTQVDPSSDMLDEEDGTEGISPAPAPDPDANQDGSEDGEEYDPALLARAQVHGLDEAAVKATFPSAEEAQRAFDFADRQALAAMQQNVPIAPVAPGTADSAMPAAPAAMPAPAAAPPVTPAAAPAEAPAVRFDPDEFGEAAAAALNAQAESHAAQMAAIQASLDRQAQDAAETRLVAQETRAVEQFHRGFDSLPESWQDALGDDLSQQKLFLAAQHLARGQYMNATPEMIVEAAARSAFGAQLDVITRQEALDTHQSRREQTQFASSASTDAPVIGPDAARQTMEQGIRDLGILRG